MTYIYVKYFFEKFMKQGGPQLKLKTGNNYRLFSFSQGQGIGLYFLYLCWVAQDDETNTIKRNTINTSNLV